MDQCMKSKWWVFGIGLVLIGGAVGGWFWFQEEEEIVAAALPTTTVQRGSLVSTISGTGSIEASSRESIIAVVEQPSEVAEVFFQDGDQVAKTDILITFEQEDAESQIRSKEIQLAKAKLTLESQQLQFKEAAEQGEDSQNQIRLNIESQLLEIEQLEKDIADLQSQNVGIDPITAPIDGKLSSFDIEPGDTIREDQELGEVVNYSHMKIVVAVDELDIAEVQLGQSAEIVVDALPDRTFTGSVVEIADEGTSSNGVASFDVTVLITEVEGLKAGMSAETTIVTQQADNALFVPIDAVQSVRGEYFVRVPNEESAEEPDETANAGGTEQQGEDGESNRQRPNRMAGAPGGMGMEMVPVEVGIHNEDYIEIVSGLSEGDEIIYTSVSGASSQNAQQRGGMGGFGGGFPGGGAGVTVPAGRFGGGGR